jgi:hypothetical protein
MSSAEGIGRSFLQLVQPLPVDLLEVNDFTHSRGYLYP